MLIKRNRLYNLLFLSTVAASLFLSSCGFHLRGTLDMPMWLNHVSVVIEKAHRNLGYYLVEDLQAFKRDVPMDPSRANYIIYVQEDHLDEALTSISSGTTPRQYELTYKVIFKLTQKGGEEIIPSNEVSVSRQMTINSDRILGSNFEQEQLKQEMRRDAAIQIINKINRETINKVMQP